MTGADVVGWSAGIVAPVSAVPVRATPAPGSETAFRALLVFTVVMLLAPQTAFPVLAPLRPALLSAVVAIGGYLLHRLLRREPLVRVSRELAISAALLWWTLLTLPLSHWVGGSIDLLLGLYLKALLIFWLLCHVVDTPRRLTTIAWWLTALAVPLAITGIRQFLGGEFLGTAERRIEGYEAALTNNPNDLALMLNLLLPLAIALALHARRQWVRLLLAAVVVLEVTGIVLTFSRSGFVTLAAIVGLQLYRLVQRGRASYAVAALVALLLAAPLLPADYLERLSTIVDTSADRTGSADTRWRDMAVAATYIAQHPIIGAGLGMDVLVLNQLRGETWTQVHDVYLQYGVDLGLPGMAMFVLLLASAVNSASRARREALAKRREDVAAIADAIWISLMAFAVAAIFYPAGYHFYFYYFAGLAVAARHVCQTVMLPRLRVPSDGRGPA